MPILDTSFLIDVLRGESTSIDRLGEALVERQQISISAISVMEIEQGLVLCGYQPSKISRAMNDLAQLNVHVVSQEIAQTAGKIRAELIQEGKSISPEDCIIAATAINNTQTLWTADRHFERITGLNVQFHR